MKIAKATGSSKSGSSELMLARPEIAWGITIGMIAKSQSNPVFLAARKGAEARAAELSKELNLDIKIDWRTPNDEDAQQQAQFIEQLVGTGVDAITIACSDASKVTRAIDDAIAKGVGRGDVWQRLDTLALRLCATPAPTAG